MNSQTPIGDLVDRIKLLRNQKVFGSKRFVRQAALEIACCEGRLDALLESRLADANLTHTSPALATVEQNPTVPVMLLQIRERMNGHNFNSADCIRLASEQFPQFQKKIKYGTNNALGVFKNSGKVKVIKKRSAKNRFDVLQWSKGVEA